MTPTAAPAPDTPTGIARPDLDALTDLEAAALYTWMRGMAGDNDGRPWWPRAVRRLPVATKVRLATDPPVDAAWRERERRRVIRDPVYFVAGYGHVQPEDGDPIPFDLWPEQQRVLRDFAEHLRVIVLKARQLGLTWLALHYSFHLQAFATHTPNAKILALSKHGGDATKLLGRARKINALLPPWLRCREDPDTVRSLTKFKLVGRGEMISLAGSPEAARMETATLALLDEFAHIKNKNAEPTWTAVGPTLGKRGKAIIIFTGNGPAETPGNGQAAARLWQKARTGAVDAETGNRRLHAVFLPTDTDPARDAAFYASVREDFLSEEDFRAEYPRDEDEALAGRTGDRVYSPRALAAAERLGAAYDDLLDAGRLPPPAGGVITGGFDFGEYTHLLLLWPLEAGGFYVAPGEVVQVAGEVGRAAAAFMRAAAALQSVDGDPDDPDAPVGPPLDWLRFDGAGVQSMRTFVRVLQEGEHPPDAPRLAGRPYLDQCVVAMRAVGYGRREPEIRYKPIPFNKYKDDARDYVRHLIGRAADGHATRILALSPRNPELNRQLRALELKDDLSGRIEKGDDHGPDALLAGLAPSAKAFRDRVDARRARAARGAAPARRPAA